MLYVCGAILCRMGVSYLWKWLTAIIASAFQSGGTHNPQPSIIFAADTLAIDVLCDLHKVVGGRWKQLTPEAVALELIRRADDRLALLTGVSTLALAFDGVPPRAKVYTQVKRREKAKLPKNCADLNDVVRVGYLVHSGFSL